MHWWNGAHFTNSCTIHLGANLRKSFISGIHKLSESDKGNTDREREHNQTDNLLINLLSYLVNMVYQNTVWESYS